MDTLNIQIRKSGNGNLQAIFEQDGQVFGYNSLFEFDYRKGVKEWGEKPSWYFWLNHSSHASHTFNGERKDFPLDFFLDACRAKYFLHPRGGEIPANVNITYGRGHIGMRNQ